MSQAFPLTQRLWLEWLEDEEKLVTSPAEAEAVTKLFERAVVDYMAVEIWLEYAQFSIGRMEASDGIGRVRCLFERALSAVGLHVAKGGLIWDAFREFENAVLCTLKSSSDEAALVKQKKRIDHLFQRQLSIPLRDMGKTREEYVDWLENPETVDALLDAKYEKARAKLLQVQPFEESLAASDPPHLEAYERYVEFEMRGNEPVRIQCIFERALVDNCLVVDLWKKYIDYLEHQLKIPTLSLPVLERSVRNCPWSVDLWQKYIRCMERHQQPHEKIKELVDRALGSGFDSSADFLQLWTSYLEYLRRRVDWTKDHTAELEELRSTFLRAHNHQIKQFGTEADADATLLRFWARVEARKCNNLRKCRELWDEAFHVGNNYTTAERWLEFIELERTNGCGGGELRKSYQKALRVVTDWPEAVGNAWISYEQEEGTLEQWELACEKYGAQLTAVQKKRSERSAESGERWQQETAVRRVDKKQASSSLKRKLLEKMENAKAKKKKLDSASKTEASTSRPTFKVPQGLPPGKWERLKPPHVPAAAASREGTLPADATASTHGEETKHDSAKDEVSVFLSNLEFSADEDSIGRHFSSVGEIASVRLVRDFKGRSKGFCYLEFKTKEAREAALQKDRDMLNGRPVFVSACTDKKRSAEDHSKFKYATGLEKKKVFVRGLQRAATKDDIKLLFEPCGVVVDVRIVTYRNGFSKGIAYVEFQNEEAAAKAVESLDGKPSGSQTLSVALSNPPSKDNPPRTSAAPTESSRNSNRWPVGGRGRGRTQVALVPRALQRTVAKTTVGDGSNGTSNGAGNGKDAVADSFRPKTNDDFRNMLLKK